MITRAETYGSLTIINASATLSHPLADEVSIALGSGQYSHFPHSVELAFFKDGEWVNEVIPEFAEWAEASNEYRVYPFVPALALALFLEKYATGEE